MWMNAFHILKKKSNHVNNEVAHQNTAIDSCEYKYKKEKQ